MKIQLFANKLDFSAFDEIEQTLNTDIANAQTQINNANIEKENLINDYNANYQNQLNQYNDLQNQQQQYIDTWAEEQKKQQQAQTDYNIGIINQNKEQAAKDTEAEIKDSYVDYMKQNNAYGGALETLASNGLATQGYAESSKIAMYNTYQNRVGTAKSALMKANTQYDNQIQQALLNNDASLAEIALQQMQESYQLALKGFEYTTNLYNQKVAYEQDINDSYFNRTQTLQSRIDSYNQQLANITEYKQTAQTNYDKWLKEYEEEQRQFNASLEEQKRQYNQTYNATYKGITYDGDGEIIETPKVEQKETAIEYASRVFGNNEKTYNKDDYYFEGTNQPRYVDNKKLNKVGIKAKEIFESSRLKELGVGEDYNIWHADGKYYVWSNTDKCYKTVPKSEVDKQAGFFDKIFHKGVGWI